MKKILVGLACFCLLSFVLISCFINPVLTIKRPFKKIPVDTLRLYKDIEYLTSFGYYRNVNHLKTLDSAAVYIYDEFSKLNCDLRYQKYQDGKFEFKNIIAVFNPQAESTIVVGAHYDVCGATPGADDNASGIAGLLEIARLIDSLKPKLKHRIEFVAYCTEEPPYFDTDAMGSAVHANSLKQANRKVEFMLCLEMIGYFCEEKKCQTFPYPQMKYLFPTTGDYILLVDRLGHNHVLRHVKKRMKQVAKIKVRSLNSAVEYGGIDLSDHKNYWSNGYEAVMLTNTAFYRNDNYHELSDSITTLDFAKMSEVVKGAYWAVVKY